MKLLGRTSLFYAAFSLVTYVVIAGSFYVLVERMIYREVEDRLKVERRDFEHFVRTHGIWEESCYFVEDKISLVSVSDTLKPLAEFKDTLMDNRYNRQLIPFREHTFYSAVGQGLYKVSIRKSLIESKSLLKSITVTLLITLSIGLLVLYLFQRRFSKVLWRPFYNTLAKAKAFDVSTGSALDLTAEPIYEFNELNSELEKMTEKISQDYRNLKEFTENASHEIQTPLALINSRVEELIQETNVAPKQMSWIQDIHESTLRLSRLNHALLLLSKIDNGQFYEREPINVNALIRSKLSALEEIFNLKGLTVSYKEEGTLVLPMNGILADALFTNLLNNSVKHNVRPGTIDIFIDDRKFVIRNSGDTLNENPEVLFERFRKHNQSSNSLGLGLAIVKKISDVHRLKISYTYSDRFHTFKLTPL
ncbi:HAMP domain-containing sensor histidine kinase [Chryseolinea sp. T2]|uniref:sensor histidine kinase n=1 Tax=Chryseolinea sp. T2 TaxID=3129255 RepID=UPI00307832D2